MDAQVDIPGSKSLTNRALLLAAISTERTTITRPLLARDTRLMMAALQALGIGVDEDDDGATVTVTPHHMLGPAAIDCGLAGTVMR
ncbi:MAG: 3-phosphoshikimate 1-carboxyvinyltransferase, partial [Nocardioidaceae bacterium]